MEVQSDYDSTYHVGRMINSLSHQLKRQMCILEEDSGLTNMQSLVLHFIAFQTLERDIYQKDVEKAIKATQEIEREYGLTRTEGLGKTRRRLELSELKMMERTQKLSDKQIIKIYVEKSLAKSSTMEDFRLNLTDYGITIRFNTAKKGHISGISFQRGDFAIKGSKLGSKYSYASLSRRLPSVMEISIGNEQTLSKQREHTRTR